MRAALRCLMLSFVAVATGMVTSGLTQNTGLASCEYIFVMQDQEPTELSDEEAKSIKIADRFFTILEKSPRRGTALERVYGHHVEFGTLDKFLQGLRDRVEKDPSDGTAWMLLGMFEAHRGQDAEAVDAFAKAEEFRTEDAMPSYYMGQSQLLIGQPEKAVAAFERAIERKPRRPDMLEIFRQLGRVHQRAQRTDDALKVWDRLEQIFPDDARVQEQIAITMVEEGEYELALPRYEKLATLVKDDYRRVTFNVEAAELHIRLGKRDKGIASLEELLANLNPTGWLFRDVRRRIEDVFLRSGDQDGLVKYYEKWINKNPEDIGAIARLARFLASSARVEEASQWMEKALKLAPKRTDLRKSFIDQLVNDQRYAEASQQYAELVESAPGNPDFLRDWGKLVMKNRKIEESTRRQQAMKIWSRIVDARPNDALTHAQVADLYRQSGLESEAIERYEKAVELSPGEPQYREYLGEYFHILKRSEDALKTWESIAEGDRKTADNLARLAEVYNSFGYLPQAVEKIAIACELEPKEFTLQLRAAEYHMRHSKFDEALGYNTKASDLSASEEESELALNNRIEIFQTNRKLDEEIDRLRSIAESTADQSADQWHTLARYLEADRDWAAATESLEKALAINPKSIPVLTTSARIAETSGDYGRAAAENRKLAEIDRRLRSEHLMNVARLEAQLGNRDEALAAGQELIVSAPGNTDNYEFYSQLCYRLGENEKGLDALRKAVRINPTEPALTMSLGRALAEEFRNDEAIEVYWRAFEKSEEIDDKTSLIQKLTPLYEQQNQFDKLLERLERDRREESKRREMTICLAQAHNSAGDYGTARRELESLLTDNTKDTNLLQQLSKLCESSSDLTAAVEYQTQLAKVAPGHESEFRLAKLLFSNGQRDAASEIFLKLTAREENPVRRLKSVDGLLRRNDYESVIRITEPLLSESRDNWELLYREGVALAKLEKTDEAKIRFERILSLSLPHDKMGVNAEERLKRAKQKAKSNNNQGIRTRAPNQQSAFQLARGQADAAKRAVGLEENHYYGNNQLPPLWTPSHFGVARMAAIAWLSRFETDAEVDREIAVADTDESEDEDESEDLDDLEEPEDPPSFTDAIVETGQKEGANIEDVYDWLYVESLNNNYSQIFKISRSLAIDGGKPEQQFFLSSLPMRGVDPKAVSNGSEQDLDDNDPLSDADIELMLKCYEAVKKDDEGFDDKFASGQIVTSGGRMYIRVGNTWHSIGDGDVSLTQLVKELKLAGREELGEKMMTERIDAAKKPTQLIVAMQMMMSQKKTGRMDEFFERWKTAALEEIEMAPIKVARRNSSQKFSANQAARVTQLVRKWTGPMAAEEENAKVLAVINDVLDVEMVERVKVRKQKKASRRKSSRSGNTYYDNDVPYQYGEEQSSSRVDYPRPGSYLSTTGLHMLRQAFEVLKRNEVEEDLMTLIRDRVKKAESNAPETLPFEQMLLATLLFWQDEKDEAVEVFRAVATQVKDDPSFQFEIASLYEKLGELDESLNVIEAIEPREQKLVQQKETTVLRLAERLGDLDRARTAAERLFGLRLKAQTQLSLVANMKRLGMVEMADAVVSRAQRRGGQKISAMVSLMGLYQGQGKTDLATQVAHRILQRTRSSVSQKTAMNRNRRYGSSSNSNDSYRRSAISTMQQTGALTDVIARLEKQQARSPDSPMIYEQLIEFYMQTNDSDKLIPLLETAVETRPKSAWLREQLAKQYSAKGKKKEACQQYAAAIRANPSILSDDYYEIKQFFKSADQMSELLKIFEEVNIREIGQPYYIANFASELLQQTQNADTEAMSEEEKKAHDVTEETAYRLAEKIFDQFPSYRRYVIQNFRSEEAWKNKRLFKLARRSIIPARSQVKADPWFGLNDISSYRGNGEVNSMFHDIFRSIEGTDQEAVLCDTIRKSIEKKPEWLAGKVMLAMFDVRNDKEEDAKKALAELFADEKSMDSVKGEAAWLVAQELEKFTETRDIAVKLLEKANKQKDRNNNQIQYTVAGKLISIYVDADEKEKAREMLLEAAQNNSHENYDRRYQLYQKGETAKWVSEKLMELSYPADAVSIMQTVINDDEMLSATQYYGSNDLSAFNSLYARAIEKAVAKAETVDIASKIIVVRDKPRTGEGALDLQIGIAGDNRDREPLYYHTINGQSVPYYGEESATKPIVESKLFGLIDTISKKDAGKKLLEKRLDEIQSEKPEDKSIAIVRTWFRLNHRDEETVEAAKALLEIVEKQPLDEIREGRRPNSRQRRQAMQHLALWPIAQKCLENKEEDVKELGRKFGDLAIEGAMRQTDKAFGHHMLFDWGSLAAKNKNPEEAEAKWARLLDDVTKRPTRKKKKKKEGMVPGTPVPMEIPGKTGMLNPGTILKGLFEESGRRTTADITLPLGGSAVAAHGSFGWGGRSSLSEPTEKHVSLCVLEEKRNAELGAMHPPRRMLQKQQAPTLPEGGCSTSLNSVKTSLWEGRTLVASLNPLSLTSMLQVPVFRKAQRATNVPSNDEPAVPSAMIPPLTNSQFQIAHQVALAAADNDMIDLSKRAMRELLKGGLPVADPSFGNEDSNNRRTVVYSSSMGTSTVAPGDATNATEYGSQIMLILAAWEKKEKSFPPAEVYEMVAGEVFPPNRKDEILLYESSSSIGNASVSSLAQSLVQWAGKGERLDDLQKRIDERASNPRAETAAMVMSGLVALERKDFKATDDQLKKLLAKISEQPVPRDIALACHVAVPAWDADESLHEVCIGIYRKKMSTDKSPQLGTLSSRVNRHLASTGGEAEIRKFFESYLTGQQAQYSNYGGDYGIYQMQQSLFRCANDVAQANLTELALEYVGRGKDIKSRDYGENSVSGWELISRQIRQLPADKRYEMLKDWTLPKPDRQTIRFAATFDTANEKALADFYKPELRDLPESSSLPGFQCNFLDLIEAADAAGKMDDCKAAIEALDGKTYPEADALKLGLAIHNGDAGATEMAKAYFDKKSESNKNSKLDRRTKLWCQWLICRMGMRGSEELGAVCAEHRRAAAEGHDDETSPMVHRDYEFFRSKALGSKIQPGTLEPMKHWNTKEHLPYTNGNINPWTVASDRQLTLLGSKGAKYFWLNYPLSGNFSFTCEALAINDSSAEIDFGGAIVSSISRSRNGNVQVTSISSHDEISRRTAVKVNHNNYAKLKIEVNNGVMKQYLDGQMLYEEKLTGTYPWLTLSSKSGDKTVWRNPVFEGKPEIASQVNLVSGDRMEGWRTTNGTQIPFRKLAQPTPRDKDGKEIKQEKKEPEDYDWHAKDGVLYGKATEKADEKSDNLLSYRRPMSPGEQFSYEFQFEPGKKMANPVIGSIVIGLIDGQKPHELYAGNYELAEQSEIVNITDSPNALEPVALKQNDWNKVDLRLTDTDAEVVVNDALVWRRPLEKVNLLLPGIQKFMPQAAEVRNVVLTGNWPEAFPESAIANVFESDRELVDADRHLIAEAIGDRFRAIEIREFYDADHPEISKMTAEQRYEMLRKWVLPAHGHGFRFDHLPRPNVLRSEEQLLSQTETELDFPAWEMISLAKETGKLEDLTSKVNAMKMPEKNTESRHRKIMSLKALLAIASEDDTKARECLNDIYAGIKAEEAEAKEQKRDRKFNGDDWHAVGIATWFAAERPELLDCAASLQTKCGGSGYGPAILARIENRSDPVKSKDESGQLTQWDAVPGGWPTRKTRGPWRLASPGVLDRRPGTSNRLYFQSPLTGKFEITADVTRQNGTQCWLDYGGYAIIPNENNNHRTSIGGSSSQSKGKRKVSKLHSVINYRIAVDNKIVETYVNDVRVSRHEFKKNPRPWLTILPTGSGSRSIVQNLRITGQPEVPSEIDLLAADGLFWIGSLDRKTEEETYSNRQNSYRRHRHSQMSGHGGNSDVWTVNEGEITAGSLTEYSEDAAIFEESWARYSRPMLEDGEFEFEMFAEAKTKKLCHLSIGRTAILLKEDGIWKHDIVNNNRYIDPTDDEKIADSEGVELKDGDWNRIVLKLAEDDATLLVNDQELATFAVPDAKSLRQPGLFRFTDQSNAQVRNIKLRGSWETSLPGIEQQELALNSQVPFEDIVSGDAKVYDFAKSIDDIKAAGLEISGAAQMESTDGGLKITARKNADKPNWPQVVSNVKTKADFDVSVDFSELKIANVTDWGCNLDLEVWFEDNENTAITVGIRRDKDDDIFVMAQREYNQPDGERGYHFIQLFEPFEEGTLRLVRRGGKVYCLAGPAGETQKVITSFTVGGKTAQKFSVIAKSSTDTSELDGVVKQMSLKVAEED